MHKKTIKKILALIIDNKKIYSINELKRLYGIEYRTYKKIENIFFKQKIKNSQGKSRVRLIIKENTKNIIDKLLKLNNNELDLLRFVINSNYLKYFKILNVKKGQ